VDIEMDIKDIISNKRKFMKSNFDEADRLGIESDQEKELPQPPLQNAYEDNSTIIGLPDFDSSMLSKVDIYECLKDRRSVRQYKDEELTLKELSFLLWATQGVDKVINDGYATRRPVPSAGARHPFETYIIVDKVEGLQKGMYRYLPITHELLYMYSDDDMAQKVTEASLGQSFVGRSSVVFIWSCVAYRGEWRYSIMAHKPMLLDAGHICQNLYLACEAIKCGTCAVAAYDQTLTDNIIKVDGEEEFTVYLSPVGKV
jgi:SagB-type dehydrogenase family enzyme